MATLSQLCNKCGLFERTHSRPRPEQFPHKRGPIATTTFKSSRSPPPQSRLPPMQMSLPPHHYDHPSIAPLMPRADGQPQYATAPGGSGSPNPSAIGNLLNSPAGGASQQQQQQQPPPPSGQAGGSASAAVSSPAPAQATVPGGTAPAPVGNGESNGNLKRPRSPSADQSPRQEQRSPPYAYRAVAQAAPAA